MISRHADYGAVYLMLKNKINLEVATWHVILPECLGCNNRINEKVMLLAPTDIAT